MIFLSFLLKTLMTFIATEIDDFLIFVLLFSKNKSNKSRFVIMLSQITVLVLITGLCGFVATLLSRIPEQYLRFIGILPLIIGVISIFKKEDEKDISAGKQMGLFLTGAIIMLAASTDNLGVYIPFFVGMTVLQKLYCLIIFIIMQIFWSLLQIKASDFPAVQTIIEKTGKILEPVVFIGLGLIIIFQLGF